MRPGDFRPVFAAGDAFDATQGPMEVEACRWFRHPAERTNDDVKAFCDKLAKRYGLKLVAIDVAQGGVGAAFGRYDRLRLAPQALRAAEAEFLGKAPPVIREAATR